MSKASGFIYADQHKAVELSHAEWRTKFQGMRRRVENGETYYHGPDGKIVAEVYANVSPARVAEVA